MILSENTAKLNRANKTLRFMLQFLVVTIWVSAIVFGLYILAFYFIGLLQGNPAQWNEVLPELYDPSTRSATIGIGIHFAAGGLILILGCIQLLDQVRARFLTLHRWLGGLYITASLLAGIGGLIFIFVKGTIGGLVMDIGFAGYGILMILAAIQTFRYAKAKQIAQHRAWGIRLFALAIGSWLYRMDYGFWMMFTDGLWQGPNFQGGFDYFMDFFFYIPNLIIAEIFIRKDEWIDTFRHQWLASGVLFIVTAFLLVANYFFITHYWGTAILDVFR